MHPFPRRLRSLAPMLALLVLAAPSVRAEPPTPAGGWELRVCADPSSLPFSARERPGLENEIAAVLANDLGARLTFDWHLFNGDLVDEELRGGACDLIMGVPDGYAGLSTTIPYYQSPYVFVTRTDAGLSDLTLDDPRLATLRIGVQSQGSPPQDALVRRGLGPRVVAVYGGGATRVDHLDAVVAAVAKGDIDVGVAWGPVAAYYAARQDVPLDVEPVTPAFDPPDTVMSTGMTIAVRTGDDSLRDLLEVAVADRWDQIQAILGAYGVPREPMPRPVPGGRSRPAARGGAAPILRVGVVVPTKSPGRLIAASLYDLVGEAARRGALLAEGEIGALQDDGGVAVDVLVASAPSPAAAQRAADRLLATGAVDALVGGVGAGQAEVLAAAAERHGVPFLNVGSTGMDLRRQCVHTTFHVEASASMYLEALAAWYAGPPHGAERWYLVGYGSAAGADLQRRAAAALAAAAPGASVVGSAAVAVNAPVYDTVLQALRASGADAVMVLLDAADQVAFTARLAQVAPDVLAAAFPDPVSQTRDFLAAVRSRSGPVGLADRVALWDTAFGEGAAAALDDRFTGRWGAPMDPSAWATYAAVEILHSAAVRAGSPEPSALVALLADPAQTFDVAKGAPLAFTGPDQQLAQPLFAVRLDPEAPWDLAVGKQIAIASPVGRLPADGLLGDGSGDVTCER